MSYDEALANRIRKHLAAHLGISERKMFGGIAFMLDGKMLCGVIDKDLMARVGPEAYEDALGRAHVRMMDFTGRPMKGYVYVAPAGHRTERALGAWIERCAEFVVTLAAPNAGSSRARRRSPGRSRGR